MSRTLKTAERGYSQLEKEALAIICVLSQLYDYLWGQANFTVVTDHKPLLGLFSNTKSILTQASGRIQWWALALSRKTIIFIQFTVRENYYDLRMLSVDSHYQV